MALPQVGLEAVIAGLPGFEAGAKAITKAYDDINKKAGGVESSTNKLGKSFLALGNNVLKFGGIIGGLGLGALALGIGGVANAGFEFNDALEQTTARINAFTKDGAKTAQIVEDIRKEAALTPFTFQEMASAVASLLPAAKASGVSIDDLIKQAEILAASNPAEGLEGAAFSLKEALSGDFVSIVERFNLPRGRINELKKEGVPALEAIQTAMLEMGLDIDLVSSLANTAKGRWSTFTDTLTNLAGMITQPIFDTFSGGLGRVNEFLLANEPLLTAFAANIANAISQIIAKGQELFLAFQSGGAGGLMAALGFTPETIAAVNQAIGFFVDHIEEFKGALIGIGAVLAGAAIAASIAAVAGAIAAIASPIGIVIAAAALLGAAWATNWGGIQEKTFAMWAVVQPILTQMGQWLSVNIPIAIQFLADAWNNVLFPAITAVANWLTGTWFPLQIQWWTFVGTTLVEAITTLSDTWTNTLLPAITAVSDYLNTNVFPLFRAFNDFTFAVFNKTIQAAAGLWQNVLWPALDRVWAIISNSLQPIFKSLGEIVEEKVSPTLNTLGGDILPALAEGLETVTRWIKEATGFFRGLTDAVNSFTLPPVLTPGSPTPFEIALLGIANAADQAGISMENLNNLSMPGMFDKLFKINREITSFKNLMQGAKDGIVSWGKANYIGSEKSENAIKFFKDQWKKHFDEIMAAGNPLEAWTDIVSQREWRLIGLKPDQARKMGSIFFENFFKTADKSANALQNMIIRGSQTALQMANQLNQFGSQQAEYLNSQVETLQAFIKSGEAEMNFEGQIISATQAQELLNQKLADQAAIQDDILQIKQQESKLQFLQSQLDLIKMIKDAGLNVKDVLGNITLGLDASIPDMLAATNNVIQAIINQVDRDLGSIIGIGGAIGGAIVNGVTGSLQIASDSKVMARLGQYTMSGFVNGMMSQVPNLFAGVQQAITGPAIVSAPVLAGAGGQTIYMENNFGGNNISGQMDSAQFDAMVLRSLQRLM